MGNTNEKRIEIVIEIDKNRNTATQLSIDGANAIEIISGYVYAANSLAKVISKHDGVPKTHVLDTMAKSLRAIVDCPGLVQNADKEGADKEGADNGND